MSETISELVEMFYDISTLIPDQQYRNIMDKLSKINSNCNKEMFLVGTASWNDGETRAIYISSDTIAEDMLLVSSYERLRIEREQLRDQINDMRRNSREEIDHLNRIIKDLSARINEPPPRPNAEIELEKALQKIDQLTKLNKKSRFNR